MADPDPIFQVASGFLAAKHLFVAVEIGLFEKLSQGPATLQELVQRTGIPVRTLRITADAMVALSFIEWQGERYRNGPLAATFLAGTGQPDLRSFLRFWNRISYFRHARLEDAIRTDEIIFKTALNEQEQRLYSEGVEAVTAIGGTRDQDLLVVHGTAIQRYGDARVTCPMVEDPAFDHRVSEQGLKTRTDVEVAPGARSPRRRASKSRSRPSRSRVAHACAV